MLFPICWDQRRPLVTSLLSIPALLELLTHATPTDIPISEPNCNAILLAGDVLLAHLPVGHVEEVVKGFLSGAGSWEDVECKFNFPQRSGMTVNAEHVVLYRRSLVRNYITIRRSPPTPIPDSSIPLDLTTAESATPNEPKLEPEQEIEPAPAEPQTESEIIANGPGLPAPNTTGGRFHSMQESELDAPADMTESRCGRVLGGF